MARLALPPIPVDAPARLQGYLVNLHAALERAQGHLEPLPLFTAPTVADLPLAARFRDCVALVRADGLIYRSDGAVWTAT